MEFVSIQDLIIMLIGIIVLVIWIVLFFAGKKYNSIFEVLDDKEFRLKAMYGMGYFILEKLNFNYNSKKDRENRKALEILYDEKFADYYLRVYRCKQITFALLMVVLAFIFYGLSSEIFALVFCLALAGLGYYSFGNDPKKKIEERSDLLLSEFSEVVSKLALLTNAGMILREAWENVAESSSGLIYEEMKNAVIDMQNGISEIESIRRFGNRCMLPEIKKFTSTIIQGMTKGNKDLAIMLQKQSAEVWEIKRQIVKRKSAQADNKLLLPMGIMFIGIIVMIMVPIFTNLGM